jgi:protein-disulfide isomerase
LKRARHNNQQNHSDFQEQTMNKAAIVGLGVLLISGASVAFGYLAGQTPATVITAEGEPASPPLEASDEKIEAVVRNYLLKNPEIMVEVQTALETKRDEQNRAARNAFIAKAGADLFNDREDAVLGNANGDVTVVEFFDYNCGYCRRAVGDMQALLKTDENVRFVLKELPILGPDSVKAHIVAHAFKKLVPQKYSEFHVALMEAGQATEESALALAVSLGADEAELRTGMGDPAIGASFERNNNLAEGLNITGTPSYVIKDEVVPGALGLEVLSEKVANVRQCQKATC